MYIEQVLSICDTLYPNSYTDKEKYNWCDELSEMLSLKYNTEYERAELEEIDGKYLLPQGVTASMIDTLICGNTILKKQDMRRFGIFFSDPKRGEEVFLPKNKSYKRIYAVYIKPHEKIRDVEYEGEIEFKTDCFIIDKCLFVPGDILSIETDGETLSDVFVADCEPILNSDKVQISVMGTAFTAGKRKAEIKRQVTEQTACPPPYDGMYIDYVLGKICYYQNDFEGYNHHMAQCNVKLEDFARWTKSHPSAEHYAVKLKNWW